MTIQRQIQPQPVSGDFTIVSAIIQPMQSDMQLNIETPENIAFGYDVAGIGSRFMATFIDTVLLVMLQILAWLVITAFVGIADLVSGSGWVIGFGLALTFLLFWGYYILFETFWNGQTPGKRRIGLRVVDRHGVPIGLAASLIRNLVRIIDFFPIGYGLGVVVMFLSGRSLRLGDLAAGTLVVFDKDVSISSLDATQTKQRNLIPVEAHRMALIDLPLEKLSSADIELATDYLYRRDELANDRQLLRPILTHLYSKMEVELEPTLDYRIALSRIGQIVEGRQGSATTTS